MPERILVTGATGFLGRRLIRALRADQHQIVATSRDPARARDALGDSVACFGWDYREEPFPPEALKEVSVVYHLMGENIGTGRWTRSKKEALRGSRILSTRKLVSTLHDEVTDFLCASAIGIYPGDTHEPFDERSPLPKPSSFMTRLCADWERAAAEAGTATRRQTCLRIGLVLGESGMLRSLVPLYRLGLGGPLGDGRQLVPWVHVEDVVEMLRFVLAHRELDGPINLVGPAPVALGAFSKALASALKRPHLLRVPAPLVRVALGEASALVLSSYNVLPTKLAESGFEFRYRTHQSALDRVVREFY
jgi:uncharacterized protein (TIGR01777 family)